MLFLSQFTKPCQTTSLKLSVLAILVGLTACQQSQSPVTQTPSPETSPANVVQPSPSTKPDSTDTQIIDNLEDNDRFNALGGEWFTYDDKPSGGDSVVSPAPGKFSPSEGGANGSTRAAKITGKVTKTAPGSSIAIATNLGKSDIDISKYKGIEFWAKGDGNKYQMLIVSPMIKDYNYYTYVFTAKPEWTRHEVLFNQIKQEDYGKKTVYFPVADALKQVKTLIWRPYPVGQPRENVELSIDDVKLIK